MDHYWWIRFRSPAEKLELDQSELFEMGATGVEEVDEASIASAPVLNSANAVGQTLLKGFFETESEYQAARLFFSKRPDFASGQEKVEDWDQSWRLQQTPVPVTDRLVVVPPWVAPDGHYANVIKLEAKMAFGTGSHETTRIAALLMESLPIKDSHVLDIGTGTGLLAIYAAMLGASDVLALDIDPVVGPCLNENLVLNPPPAECKFRTLISETSALNRMAKFDLVLCNMIRTELWPFREELRSRLTTKGFFVVSGQRLEDKIYFENWQKTSPFKIVQELEINGWWGFAASVN